MKFKIKTWFKIFKWMLFISIVYLIICIIPPTVIAGVYVGIWCTLWCSGFTLYTRHLIKQGKGDELRP